MKILHFYCEKNGGEIGGVEYHIRYLVQEQQKLGLTPCVLTYKLSDKNNLTIEKRNGVEWYFLEEKNPLYNVTKWSKSFESAKLGLIITAIDTIRQNFYLSEKLALINQINPDIVHQHDYLSSVWLSRKISEKFKIVFTNHYGEYLFLKRYRLTRYFQNLFLKPFRHIIAPSQNLIHGNGQSYLIPNGIDTAVFNGLSKTDKEKLKGENDFQNKVVFLCARRWAPTKGIIYLAMALNLLPEEVKRKSVFLFAGNDAEDFQLYKKQVHSELNKTRGVDFRLFGNINHTKLPTLINISDVGIIPSLMEGMSLFSMELISCGVPVLATNVGGLPEVIVTNENGWLVPPKNAEALAAEIIKIVNNGPNSNLEINTREFRNKYSWHTIAKQTLEIYNKL